METETKGCEEGRGEVVGWGNEGAEKSGSEVQGVEEKEEEKGGRAGGRAEERGEGGGGRARRGGDGGEVPDVLGGRVQARVLGAVGEWAV
ncbi:hypothetical protein B1218_36405 [Pseudomonas ogarae]|nr:hypothetical protein B1218_36405 [Pseudomonas ogarae]